MKAPDILFQSSQTRYPDEERFVCKSCGNHCIFEDIPSSRVNYSTGCIKCKCSKGIMKLVSVEELFLITCVAQRLSETEGIGNLKLEDFIELGAILYYDSHGFSTSLSEDLADSAVMQIRLIWKNNNGCWPDKYRV